MRLSTLQQQAIVETFREVFGKGEVRLFGSRVDDARRGGDIDLYVIPVAYSDIADKRIDFLVKLKRRIGDQKIDLVIAQQPPRPIDHVAQQQGIPLCRTH